MSKQINQESLRKSEKIGKQLERTLNKINKKITNAPLGVINRVDSFEKEREKIEEIINFYNNFLQLNDIYEKEKKFLESNFILNHKYKLSFLKEKGFLDSINKLILEKRKIEFYDEIQIVNKIMSEISPFLQNFIDLAEISFFHSMKENFPNLENETKEFSYFMQENKEKKDFFDKYIKVFYEKYKFGDVYMKRKEIIDRIAYYDILFNEIKKNNALILKSEDVNTTNQSIFKLLIADAKSSLSDALLRIEKRNKTEDVVFLMALINILQKKENYSEFKDIKNECFKMINNILVSLLEEIGFATRPNKFYTKENFLLHSYILINAFEKNNELTNEILKRVEVFKSNDLFSFKKEIGNKCFTKIINLSEYMEGMNKRIYLTNNLFLLRNIISEFGKNNLEELMVENKREIIETWRNELNKRKGKDLTDFIDSHLLILNKFSLPEGIREEVIKEFKEIIYDVIKTSSYRNKTETLNKEIENAFLGK